MIDYNSAPENVRKLALIFLEAAAFRSTEPRGRVQLPASVLLALSRRAGLSPAELVHAVRWVAHHISTQAPKLAVLNGLLSRSAVAAWEAYAQELEKFAPARELSRSSSDPDPRDAPIARPDH
jgi:hypothetical protein